jgi:hypothetical protein
MILLVGSRSSPARDLAIKYICHNSCLTSVQPIVILSLSDISHGASNFIHSIENLVLFKTADFVTAFNHAIIDRDKDTFRPTLFLEVESVINMDHLNDTNFEFLECFYVSSCLIFDQF